MANALYDKAKTGFMNEEIKMLTDTIGVYLVTGSYSETLTTDDFITDVASANMVAHGSLSNVAMSSTGVIDADDLTFSSVTGSQIVHIVLDMETGTPASSPLIAVIDTGTGLPVTPNGGDITIQWDSGANKIFAL